MGPCMTRPRFLGQSHAPPGRTEIDSAPGGHDSNWPAEAVCTSRLLHVCFRRIIRRRWCTSPLRPGGPLRLRGLPIHRVSLPLLGRRHRRCQGGVPATEGMETRMEDVSPLVFSPPHSSSGWVAAFASHPVIRGPTLYILDMLRGPSNHGLYVPGRRIYSSSRSCRKGRCTAP